MKRYLALAATAALLLAGCNEETDDSQQSFRLDSTTVTLKSGEADTVDVIFSAKNVTPTAVVDTAADDWLSASVAARAVTFSVTRNTSGDSRTGVIHITAGKLPSVDLTVTQPKFAAASGGELTVGDLIGDAASGQGIVYWVDPENAKIGKAVSVSRTTGLAWGPTGEVTGAVSQVNGSYNDSLICNSQHQAAYWCSQLGEGWYLPAKNEMVELFSVYNGVDASLATVAQPKDLTGTEIQARAAFDAFLTGAGGDKMNTAADNNNGQSYWTSTEYDADAALFVRFGKYTVGHDVNKTSTSRYVRCVKTIGRYTYAAEPASMTLSPSSLAFQGKDSTATVTAKVSFGRLDKAEVDPEGASWCSASVSGNEVSVSVTANESGAARSTVVYVIALPDAAGADSLRKELPVEQAADGKYRIGQVVYDGQTPQGIVFWVNSAADSAKIVAMKRSAKVAWATEGCGIDTTYVGCDNADYGKPNMDKVVLLAESDTAKLHWLAYIQGLGEGWYFPAHNELKLIFEAYNGTTFGGATNKAYDQCTQAEIASRDAFNKTLTDLGGDPIDDKSQSNGDQYLASDESTANLNNGTEVYSVRFGKVALNKDTAKKGTTRYVRAVKIVN